MEHRKDLLKELLSNGVNTDSRTAENARAESWPDRHGRRQTEARMAQDIDNEATFSFHGRPLATLMTDFINTCKYLPEPMQSSDWQATHGTDRQFARVAGFANALFAHQFAGTVSEHRALDDDLLTPRAAAAHIAEVAATKIEPLIPAIRKATGRVQVDMWDGLNPVDAGDRRQVNEALADIRDTAVALLKARGIDCEPRVKASGSRGR